MRARSARVYDELDRRRYPISHREHRRDFSKTFPAKSGVSGEVAPGKTKVDSRQRKGRRRDRGGDSDRDASA